MTLPAVSVIMAAYNGAPFIRETLDSLFAQTFTDFEVLVVDDCSTDDTLAVLKSCAEPRLRVIEAPANGGPAQARNRAFAAARGRYIAGLDQDDLCHPDRLARQVAFLDANPDVVLVATAAQSFGDGADRPLSEPLVTTPDLIDWMMLIRNPLTWSSVMFRGDAARRLTPFERPEMLYVEDFDLYHRLRPFGRIARIDEPLIKYRVHPNGASQLYHERMAAHVRRLLNEIYAPIFGTVQALAHVELVVRHLGEGLPVPDGPTLARLMEVIGSFRRMTTASRDLDPASERLMDREHARLWRAAASAALRARRVRLREALAIRPAEVAHAEAGYPRLLAAPVIGRLRAVSSAWVRPRESAA
jgi:glycosyltransferase involved in cell wall biosynthesis